ncbi:MAG: HAMP domain-containing histidine kinase [Flavobacteriaceae bacterium]|nr:HAMP domain-containing histidine kinase [Flavobacteriaceae bacterium]
MKFLKQNLWTLLIFLIGILAIYLIHNGEQKADARQNQLRLNQAHSRAINHFNNGIDKFAAIASGMRSFMNLSDELPTSEEFQLFVQNQFNDLKSNDSIAVTFIDTNHVFRYSFSRYQMDPGNLVGKSVSKFRSEKKIQLLDELLQTDELVLFPPINLVEGWIGLPVNFRVHRNDTVLGYVAPILNFNTLINDLYESELSEEFAFRFNFDGTFDFDRQRTHDGSEYYNIQEDPEFYKKFNLPESSFINSKLELYSANLNIGTAFKEVKSSVSYYIYALILGHILFTYLFYLLNKSRLKSSFLNDRLRQSNATLEEQSKEISTQNEELVKLNETKNKFFSIVSHDIKQPLNAVIGLVDLLKEQKIADPSLKKVVNSLSNSALNTVELLNNLFRWARSQTGELRFNPKVVSINDLVKKQIEYLKDQAKNKLVNIEYYGEGEVTANVDKDMIDSVVRNLISNAIKFSNANDVVVVSLSENDKEIEIEVADKGVGMQPNEIKDFFDLKTQVSKMGTSGEAGTGLGLMLCQDFVAKHHGKIDLESEVNQGTKFTVTLPKF